MLSSGGNIGLSNARFRSSVQLSRLSRTGRESVLANAHGYRGTKRESKEVDAHRITAHSIISSDQSIGGGSEHFLGTEALSIENLPAVSLQAISENEEERCCSRAHPAVDTMVAGMVSVSEPTEDDKEHNEWNLILWLAMPMFLGKLADEGSVIGMIALWSKLGTQALASANLAWTWIHVTLVFIDGAQQAQYSLVPQALGSGRKRDLGAILTSATCWTCVILLVPIGCVWLKLGSIVGYVETALGGPAGTDPAGSGSQVEVDQIDVKAIQEFINSCLLWVLPYVMSYTIIFWLECLEIVSLVSLISGVWTIARLPMGYLFMFHEDLCEYGEDQPDGCLNGYAYGFAVACVCQLLSIILIVFVWKKQHLQPERFWFGFNLKAAASWSLNWRFITFGAPLALQAGLVAWHSTLFNMLMADWGSGQVAGYGVADAITGSGGAVSLSLYAATSIRVGILLGQEKIARAKKAAVAGCVYCAATGIMEGVLLVAFRHELGELFSPDDEIARELIVESIWAVAAYYFLESVAYGLWAVLEGQMRVQIATIALVVGHWVVAVPLGFYLIRGVMVDKCYQFRNNAPIEEDDPTRWVCEDAGIWTSVLSQSPLSVAWWINCLGVLTTCLIMLIAIFASDWEQLCEDAQEELVDGEEGEGEAAVDDAGRTSDENRALSVWSESTMSDVLLSGPKLLGKTFSKEEEAVLQSGEHWVGSVADDEYDDDADIGRTWHHGARGRRTDNSNSERQTLG